MQQLPVLRVFLWGARPMPDVQILGVLISGVLVFGCAHILVCSYLLFDSRARALGDSCRLPLACMFGYLDLWIFARQGVC